MCVSDRVSGVTAVSWGALRQINRCDACNRRIVRCEESKPNNVALGVFVTSHGFRTNYLRFFAARYPEPEKSEPGMNCELKNLDDS